MTTEPRNFVATDQQLVELFDLDDVTELESSAGGKRGMLFIDVCDGQWIKYEGSTVWTFNESTPE